ncbi:MAG: DUF6017 domain-containing protein [Lachnospiraceae bacterium]|nr:DUF6017 domain-containing protein [Lachnospiraceae bacterium]
MDKVAEMNLTGNRIPASWFLTIKKATGKPNMNAIVVLSDIVYWYQPEKILDDDGKLIGYKKRFSGEYLNRSYLQISKRYGISKRDATNAIIALEKLGVVTRMFQTVFLGGNVYPNVLFLRLDAGRLFELTYPDESSGFNQQPMEKHLDMDRLWQEKSADSDPISSEQYTSLEQPVLGKENYSDQGEDNHFLSGCPSENSQSTGIYKDMSDLYAPGTCHGHIQSGSEFMENRNRCAKEDDRYINISAESGNSVRSDSPISAAPLHNMETDTWEKREVSPESVTSPAKAQDIPQISGERLPRAWAGHNPSKITKYPVCAPAGTENGDTPDNGAICPTKIRGTNKSNNKRSEYGRTDYNNCAIDPSTQSYQSELSLFQDQISYEALKCDHPTDKRIDELVRIAVDALTSTAGTLRVNCENKPASVVKAQLRKLNMFHIQFVLKCLDETTTKIRNMRTFLLTTLYNAINTMDCYYSQLFANCYHAPGREAGVC